MPTRKSQATANEDEEGEERGEERAPSVLEQAANTKGRKRGRVRSSLRRERSAHARGRSGDTERDKTRLNIQSLASPPPPHPALHAGTVTTRRLGDTGIRETWESRTATGCAGKESGGGHAEEIRSGLV
ncbi:hypothetical protein PoB_001108500 [Plakobranchus ocellatus]|uniref:Uncharacterized protein n=1 Tax=Plakobranchus ocellatus TaxID=259542 RepID=A0AAV3YQ58_9GAST|nr:hypothetical protein PoB_001108500 [Plakobranchus ocellatus]